MIAEHQWRDLGGEAGVAVCGLHSIRLGETLEWSIISWAIGTRLG